MKQPKHEDDPELLRCISAALEMRDQGLEPPLDEICSGRQDLIGKVASAVGLADKLPALQRRTVVHDSFVGRILEGRYRLDGRLGAGAMGVVYRGVDLELSRPVAVKILHAAVLDPEEAERRFGREAEALAAIVHPSVVTVFDRGRAGTEQAYLVMELLDGAPLDSLLEEAKRRGGSVRFGDTGWIAERLGAEDAAAPAPSYLRTVVQWTADLASGLDAAHTAGVLHRDVKPSNVLVRRDGRPVLIDFGIAALRGTPTVTRREGALGTPAYMAPEALRDNASPSPAADVYGLTATLYHMFALRPPYSGSPSQVISTMLRRDPTPVHRLLPGLPRDLRAILDRGLARDPARRYPTCSDLEADLRAFLDHRPVEARPVSPMGRAWRRVRRSPAWRAGALVALVLVLALAGRSWLAGRARERRARFEHAWASVPPGFTLWRLSDRRLEAREFATLDALLSEAVALADGALPAHLYRAAFRLDHGDTEGAATDMGTVARDVDTPYARFLADAYAGLPPDAAGARALDLAGAPALRSGLDRYLAGYHLMRDVRAAKDVDEARRLLGHGDLAGFAPALDILLPVMVGLANRPTQRDARIRGFRDVFERAVRMEEAQGLRSATTAHVIGAALLGLERYADAFGPIRDGLDLAPRFHGLHSNMGIAARRVGNHALAREHLEAAIALRPEATAGYQTLAHVLIELEEFEEARRIARATPFRDDATGTARGLALCAEVEYLEALSMVASKPEAARRVAQEALPKFEQAQAAGGEGLEANLLLCRAIAEGELSAAFTPLVQSLRSDPSNWERMRTLLDLMPPFLDEAQTSALSEYLGALIAHLAPELEPSRSPVDTPSED